MPPIPDTLPELVEQLGRTFSPFERLKILTRAWGLLRRMKPEERLAVAAHLGLDQADEVVEAIAERTGTAASPALLSLIERAQVKGSTHLPQLLSDLRDPKRRAARLREGARAVEASLAGAEAAPPWLPPAVASPAPLPPPRQAAAPPPARTDADEHGRTPPPPPPRPPAPAPAVAPPAPVPAEPAVPPAPVAAAPAEPPRPAPPAPPPVPVTAKPAQEDGTFAARLAATPSLVIRFRRLRQHLEGGRPAGDLQALLDVFPDGWARRRALGALLEAGVPEKAADAVLLLHALSSERDRLWCLGAFAGSRRMSEADRETLLGTVASPAVRRRLERRLGKP